MEPQTIITIPNVSDITVADFNGDTNPDFAISAGGTVQPWFGNGSGTTFNPGAVVSGFNLAQTIIAHDLDDDGDLDLSSGNAYTLNNGSGKSAARIGFTQTGDRITVGDLNGDGKTDIIATDNSQNTPNVRVFLGNGSGAFTLLAKFETRGYANGLEVADVNNDNNLDVVGIGAWGGTPYADVSGRWKRLLYECAS
ncbi:MAG: VCBS repeat-containing protein [Cytophagales bacterium]|nr:VCBS repeat-containing protein [Cytophagales bacterium]